ncbi:nck-associated protein 5 [Arapaima gigas]
MALEAQREQYERCLDEDLREERLVLRTRVLVLEQQNRALSGLSRRGVHLAPEALLQIATSPGEVGLSESRKKETPSRTVPV